MARLSPALRRALIEHTHHTQTRDELEAFAEEIAQAFAATDEDCTANAADLEILAQQLASRRKDFDGLAQVIARRRAAAERRDHP